MNVSVHYSSKQHDHYGLKLLGMILLMTVGLAYASFYLTQNFMSNSFVFGNSSKNKVYFLESSTLKMMYERNSMDYKTYLERVTYLTNVCKDEGYKTKRIYTSELDSVKKGEIVVVLDMMALGKDEIKSITEYVEQGGKLLFNFTSGFLDRQAHYQENNLVTNITSLKLDSEINIINYETNSTGYITVRLLSPFSKKGEKGQAHKLIIYDTLPIFKTSKELEADAYLTNWTQTNYVKTQIKELSKETSGLIWHGNKKRGKWVYFSFPSYLFLGQDKDTFKELFLSMLQYLQDDVVVKAYPYVDSKNIVFVSEDSEYKFGNLKRFSDTSLKNHFPVTAFCMAQSAEKYSDMMKDVAKNPYMEIGSHSYTHKKIVGLSDEVYEKETKGSKELLEKLTDKKVIGFRPPREEVDEKMLGYLKDAGYKYIFTETMNRLYPYFDKDILNIPRHGLDDYSYLVNLDWNTTQILSSMEQQLDVVTSLNGIFTLSVHTHLMSYGTNIAIEDKFFKYVNAHKKYKAMNGEMIYKRITAMENFSYRYEITPKKIILTLSNNAAIPLKNLHLELDTSAGVKLLNVDSEIIGLKTKLTKEKENLYTIVVKDIQPKAQIMLFVNYEKN